MEIERLTTDGQIAILNVESSKLGVYIYIELVDWCKLGRGDVDC